MLDPVPFWSARRPAPARLRRGDYLGGSSPLAETARELVLSRVGRRPAGPVLLLANPRYFGVGFNPVSFYFLHGEDGVNVEAVIAEVTNTPWGERTAYVLDGRSREHDGTIRGRFDKEMHVSPFQPMDQAYEIAVGDAGRGPARVHRATSKPAARCFAATTGAAQAGDDAAANGGAARALSAGDARDARPHLLPTR